MGNIGADGHSRTFYTRSPVKVMSDALSVSVGTTHVMAIKKDGTLWSWGVLSYNPSAIYQKIPPLSRNTTPTFYETNCKIFSQRRLDPGYIPDFLQPVYDEDVITKAKEITAGISDDYDKAKAIYDWIYKDAAQSNLSDHLEELAAAIPYIGEGISNFAVELLNASGIPARMVGGTANNTHSKYKDVAWNEAFVNGRWIIMNTPRGHDEWFDVSLEHLSETNCYTDYVAITYGVTSSAIPMKIMDGVKIPTSTK
jgi:hypothetical protein